MKREWETVVAQDGAVAKVLYDDHGRLVDMLLVKAADWRFSSPNKLQLMLAGLR